MGWHDVILMQTMRNPQLLPCGHIMDKESIKDFGACSFDRKPFEESKLIPVNPAITLVERDSDLKWRALVVDTLREPLDPKVMFHPSCGEFYNIKSVQILYNIGKDKTVLDDPIKKALKGSLCNGCRKK